MSTTMGVLVTEGAIGATRMPAGALADAAAQATKTMGISSEKTVVAIRLRRGKRPGW